MKLLRLFQVVNKTGLSRAMIYKLMKLNEFPMNVHISVRSVAWVDSEVEGWMANRLAVRDTKEDTATNGGRVCL